MRQRKAVSVGVLVAATGIAVGTANADFLGDSTVIAKSLDVAPGTGGLFFAGSGAIGSVQVDQTGRVYYAGVLFVTGDVTNLNKNGIWSGTSAADNALVVRDGSQVQGQANGVIINTSAAVGGLGTSNFRVQGNGVMFGAQFTGPGITANVNDSALFRGTSAGYSIGARRGDAAGGTAGAAFNTNFKSISQQLSALNASGQFAMQVALSGGDVSGTTNNSAIYAGSFAAPTLVVRKGDNLGGGLTQGTLDFNAKINAAGEVFYDGKVAGAGVTTANDSAWWLHDASGNHRIYREGDAAGGTVGASFTGQASTGGRSYSNAGMLMVGGVTGGDTVAGVNDQVMYRARTGGMDVILRRGDATQYSGLNYGVANSSSLSMTNYGRIAFQSTLTGVGVTADNDTALWAGSVNGNDLAIVAREGDLATGTAGAVFGASFGGTSYAMNDIGQILFTSALIGGDVTGAGNDSALFVWDRSAGLQMVLREGGSYDVGGGDNRTISSWIIQGGDNGNGGCLGFNDSGVVGMRLLFTDGTDAVIRMTNVPAPSVLSVLGLGLFAGRRRR